MPDPSSASTAPATSPASGPMTARSTAFSLAAATIAAASSAATSGRHSASAAIPALPGAQRTIRHLRRAPQRPHDRVLATASAYDQDPQRS